MFIKDWRVRSEQRRLRGAVGLEDRGENISGKALKGAAEHLADDEVGLSGHVQVAAGGGEAGLRSWEEGRGRGERWAGKEM